MSKKQRLEEKLTNAYNEMLRLYSIGLENPTLNQKIDDLIKMIKECD